MTRSVARSKAVERLSASLDECLPQIWRWRRVVPHFIGFMRSFSSGSLRGLGSEPSSWSNGPGQTYAAHAHGYDKALACTAGSIAFGLPDVRERYELRPGDRLDLPAGTNHDALVGDEGVTCLESHLPAGRVGELRLRRAGTW